MFPDFVPIEFRGVSIITAVILSFYAAIAGLSYSMFKREFKRIGKTLEEHEEKLENNRDDIAGMKTNIALTLQSVTRMERILERKKED